MPGSRYGSYVKPVLSPVPLAAAKTFDPGADLTSSPLGNTPRLTLNKIPKLIGLNNLGDSSLSDDGVNLSTAETLLPSSDNTQNLGSASKRFAAVFVANKVNLGNSGAAFYDKFNNGNVAFASTNNFLFPDVDNSIDLGVSNIRWRHLNMSGRIQNYNGLASAGFGVPLIVAEGDSTGNTGTIASVAAFTVGAANGVFKVGGDVDVTAFTSGTINLQVTYTDWNSAVQTVTIDSVALLADSPGNEVTIMAKASTSITIKTTGTFTATYNVTATIIQVK